MLLVEWPTWLYGVCLVVGGWKALEFSLAVYRYWCVHAGPEYPWFELRRWAVITGGTDGIGKSYALELASRGFNICIISRNREKLKTVLQEIEEKCHVRTKAVNVAFDGNPGTYQAIKAHLIDILEDVGVLVNNVGMSYKYTEYFHALPEGPQVLGEMISSNIVACTMMLRMVLPYMEKHERGVVVNVSSLTALYPMPLLTVYAAAKAYVDHLSRATHYEYKDKGIVIQSLLPGYVATQMSLRKVSLEIPSPEAFVASAIKTVGTESYSYGYTPHKIRGFVHEWLKANMPACVNLAIAMHFMSKARQSYLRKQQRRRNRNIVR